MTSRRVVVAQTDELDDERFGELTALCESAFEEPFGPIWVRVGPGLHVMAIVGGRPVAHAMIVDRSVYLENETDVGIDVGYVENVATLPELQGHGHGTAVIEEVNRIIAEEYALGALSTGAHDFYGKLGWEPWRGAAWVRTADGQRVRSAGDDGTIMVLRTPRTPPQLDLDGPIAVDWRPGRSW